MRAAILKSVLWAFDTVNYKKVLGYRPTFLVFRISWISLSLIFWSLLLLFNPLDSVTFNFVIILFLVAGLNLVRYATNQYAYSREKISVLTPYSWIGSVFSIIWAFIIFSNVSLISFFIAILIILLSVWSNVNFKQLDFNKTILVFIWWQIFGAISSLILADMITSSISEISFFIYIRIIYLIILVVMFLILRESISKFKMWGEFYFHRTLWTINWIFRSLLELYLIKNLWLVLSTILWFLETVTTLILSYFVFWDRPKNKDIILTIIITILVFLWFYFKDYWLS